MNHSQEETGTAAEVVSTSRTKGSKQKAASADFWKEAGWTPEEKQQTLAPADEARDRVLMHVQRKKVSRLRRLIPSIKRRSDLTGYSSSPAMPSTGGGESEVADEEALAQQIKDEIERADRQMYRWALSHKRGNTTLSFLNDLLEFVGEFSGVVEIMRSVDQGYGGAAYAALSFFLSVAVNTKRKDDRVAECLVNLKNEYSRMVLLSEVCPTPQMRTYITTVYRLGIDFVREATIHYSRPTWRRLWDSLLRPPFLLDRQVSEISAAIIQIEKERDTLVSMSLDGLHTKFNNLTKRVEELHTNNDKEKFATLKNALSQHHPIQPGKTVTEYLALLQRTLNRPSNRFTQSSAAMLATKPAYNSWKNSNASCMLSLNGLTKATPTSYSWLSPAAIEIASALKQEIASRERVALAEIYCQKTDFMPDKDNASRISVVVSLALQLLDADPTILRDTEIFDDLLTKLGSIQVGDRSSGHEDFNRACEILLKVLGRFELVYIVIDRSDRIRGGYFMRDLLTRVMLNPALKYTKVRALCVACRNQQETASKLDEMSDEMDEKNFIVLRIDQVISHGRK